MFVLLFLNKTRTIPPQFLGMAQLLCFKGKVSNHGIGTVSLRGKIEGHYEDTQVSPRSDWYTSWVGGGQATDYQVRGIVSAFGEPQSRLK